MQKGKPRAWTVEPADVVAAASLSLGTILGVLGLHVAFHVAPIEAELKMTQKIFYLHAPLGIWTIVATVVAAVAAMVYLGWRREGADLLSASCMEVALVTCGLVLVTGSLWAKPAWGDWFPWGEPRVMGFLVLFLIALVYRVLRASVDEPGRRGRFAAVFAIMGAIVACFAYAAIHIWNTTHPRVITPRGIGLQQDMKHAFFLCIGATFFLVVFLVQTRYRLARLEDDLARLEMEAEEALERMEPA